jgi:hypothetical protein
MTGRGRGMRGGRGRGRSATGRGRGRGRRTHKYGIKLPKTTAEAYEIDKETGTDYWHQAIMKVAALNGLDILSADIGNAYLQAPVREKVHTPAGPEFGPQRIGQTVIVV